MVLTNPPFGKKQSLLFVTEEGDTEKEDQIIVRKDLWTSTSERRSERRLTGGAPSGNTAA
jgi:type I restriction enzyme M protein